MGKHARKKQKPGAKVVISAAIGAGVTLPFVVTGTANAVSDSEWNAIAQCESGGDWAINYSSDGLSVGGLQFQDRSWHDALGYLNSHGYDTSSWTQTLYQGMPRSAVPNKAETITAGEALLKLQPNPWLASSPCSGVYLSQSESVFNGGPTPAEFIQPGGTPTPVPTPTPTPAPVPDPQPVPVPPVHPGHHHGSHGHYWWHHWTVKKGDTLWKVSTRAYGDGSQYNRLSGYRSGNPDLIYPGEVLYVP